MGFLQLISDRTELLPPRRGAGDSGLTAHGQHMVGGREDVWLVGARGDGSGSETAFWKQ